MLVTQGMGSLDFRKHYCKTDDSPAYSTSDITYFGASSYLVPCEK